MPNRSVFVGQLKDSQHRSGERRRSSECMSVNVRVGRRPRSSTKEKEEKVEEVLMVVVVMMVVVSIFLSFNAEFCLLCRFQVAGSTASVLDPPIENSSPYDYPDNTMLIKSLKLSRSLAWFGRYYDSSLIRLPQQEFYFILSDYGKKKETSSSQEVSSYISDIHSYWILFVFLIFLFNRCGNNF